MGSVNIYCLRRCEFFPDQYPDDRAAGGHFNVGGDALVQPLRFPEVAVPVRSVSLAPFSPSEDTHLRSWGV